MPTPNYKNLLQKHGPGYFAFSQEDQSLLAFGADMAALLATLAEEKINVEQVNITRLPFGRWHYQKK